MSPAHRKELALAVVAQQLCSGRAACRFLRLARVTFWYRARPPSARQSRMRKRLRELSDQNPRYGYRPIAALLRQEGWAVGKRQVRSACAEARACACRRPGERRCAAASRDGTTDTSDAPWARLDLGLRLGRHGARRGHSDAHDLGREHTRECQVLRADRALRAADVLAWLGRAIEEHGAPQYLRSDNGPEFIAKEVQRWLAEHKVKTLYIAPGSPWQNGFVESLHGRFRDECLNREQLWTLSEARVIIEDDRQHYNHARPHSRLGYLAPARFAANRQTNNPDLHSDNHCSD